MPYQNVNGNDFSGAISQNGARDSEIVYSSEVAEIISIKPAWIVQKGIGFFLVIFSIVVMLTFFIQYPDVVNAGARLVSTNPPVELKTKLTGKLLKLYVKERDKVSKNQVIASMESVANADAVIGLYHQLLPLRRIIDSAYKLPSLQQFEIEMEFASQVTGLGEVQDEYNSFITAFRLFTQYLKEGFFLKKKAMLLVDIVLLQKQLRNLDVLKGMTKADIELAEKNFAANESLYKDKVVADVEFRSEKSKLISKRMGLPQIHASLISNESALHEKTKEILQLENEIAQQKNIFFGALNKFISKLEQWQATYIIKSPINGKVSFSEFIAENQIYLINHTICYVNPERASYYVQVSIPQNNFGKIRTGQNVLIKLAAYPFAEFGSLKGQLNYISQIPTDSGFAGRIILPNGLITNQHKLLKYREGLYAEVGVITANRRLSDRLFASLIAVFEKK